MFGLSFWEISIVIIAALVFLKPEDVPGFLKKIGNMIKKIKDYTNDITEAFSDESEKKTPKTSKLLADDGKYYDAYDVEEVYGNKLNADEVNGGEDNKEILKKESEEIKN